MKDTHPSTRLSLSTTTTTPTPTTKNFLRIFQDQGTISTSPRVLTSWRKQKVYYVYY
jgi:hypothetical protein